MEDLPIGGSLYRSETVTSRVQIFKICDLDHIASSRSRCTRDGTLSLLWLKSSAARGRGMTKVKGFGFTGIAALAFLFAFQGAVHGQAKQKASKSTAKTAADKSTSQPPPDAQYLGSETCKTCHEDVYNGWEKTPHWKTTLDTKGGPSHQGCEGCHGPGSAHVEGGGDVTKIFTFKDASTKEITDRCMTCHAGGDQHMNALNSEHTKNDVSCISCHSPHHAETRQYLLVKAQPELCYSCHSAARAAIRDALPSSRQRRADPMQRLP